MSMGQVDGFRESFEPAIVAAGLGQLEQAALPASLDLRRGATCPTGAVRTRC